MKRVCLIFKDSGSMADFIITYNISNAETDSRILSLVAIMSDRETDIACECFGAMNYANVQEAELQQAC